MFKLELEAHEVLQLGKILIIAATEEDDSEAAAIYHHLLQVIRKGDQ